MVELFYNNNNDDDDDDNNNIIIINCLEQLAVSRPLSEGR
jgi:hypothetical protein